MATDFIAPSGAPSRPAAASCDAADLSVNHGVYDIDGVALVDEDTIVMCKLPAMHIPVDVIMSCSDLDAGTALVLELDLENGDTDISLIAGSTIGQAGGVARLALHAPRMIDPVETDRDVRVRVSTAPGTGATTGTIAVTMLSRPAGRDDARITPT